MAGDIWNRISKIPGQLLGRNPFAGECPPSRVHLFGWGRPSLPFPHPWNYTRPIEILETYFRDVDKHAGSARHNRYLDLPGCDRVLVTREPAVIRAILSATGDKPGQFDRDTLPSEGIARATGRDTLLFANGPLWRRQKKLAAPPFSRSELFQPEKFDGFEQTFRKTVTERLDVLRAAQQERGEEVTRLQLEPEIKTVMLEMLVNNFFGASVPYDELRNRFVPALETVIEHIVHDTVWFTWPSAPDPAVTKAQADFEELTDLALAPRKAGLGLWEQFKSDASDEKLRSNIRVFLAGALEATTSFAGWAVYHLARQPELQDEILAEVADMDHYDPENLQQAVALRRVLEETLRLTPSLYFLPRRATVDTWVELADGRRLFIPAGTHVVLDVWHANRCEDFWGTEVSGYPAADFAPRRWDELEKKGRSAKEIMHFGFGHGPRVCPGKFLGLLEVGLVVGALVKVFRFTADEPGIDARAGVSTKPTDGVLVDLSVRPT